MPGWGEETAKLLRTDLHAQQKLTRELLEATRDMRDTTEAHTRATEAHTRATEALTQTFTMVLVEIRALRATLQSIVSPTPAHANGSGETG